MAVDLRASDAQTRYAVGLNRALPGHDGEVDKVIIFGAAFAGTPGTGNCHGQSISALAKEYGGLNAAAAGLEFPSVQALQDAISEFCED